MENQQFRGLVPDQLGIRWNELQEVPFTMVCEDVARAERSGSQPQPMVPNKIWSCRSQV